MVFDIVAEIDREIRQLEQARALLAGSQRVPTKPARKRKLTPEGRKRIVEAVKRRWALQKVSAASTKLSASMVH